MKTSSFVRACAVAAATFLACRSVHVPAFARTSATGQIGGAIVTSSSETYPADIAGIRENVQIVARTAAGAPVGSFHLGTPLPVDNGQVRVPYTIDGVPFGVAVHVFAERYVAAAPSPEPSGFYMSFDARKIGGDTATPFFSVTLSGAHPRVAGLDFSYAPIEVPPMLPPGTPAPAATATPSARAT